LISGYFTARHSPLEKTPHKARIVSGDFAGAVIALLDMAAEGTGAACADVTECSKLLGGENLTPLLEKFLFVLAKDIGDFQPMQCRAGALWVATEL
jgi:hypothetical protein